MNDNMASFISVSGESPNLINGIKYANKLGLKTGILTGSEEKNFEKKTPIILYGLTVRLTIL